MADDKVLRKIRGLLAQAEDPSATPAEAEAFSAKAEELMIRHAVDNALIEQTRGAERETPTIRTFAYESGYGKAKMHLLAGIALAFGCNVVQRRDGAEGRRVEVIGYPSDLSMIDTLYTSLLLQAQQAVTIAPQTDKRFRTSFWYGFANRVAVRMRETHRKVEQSAEPGAALVLADRKGMVQDFASQHYAGHRMGRVSGGRATSAAGYNAGKAAANAADMGGKRVNGGRVAIG